MENRDDDSLIISAIRNPTKAVQLAGESFRRNIKEIADKQFPLPFEPNQIDLANRKINWRPGQKEKLANDAVSFAAGNNPAMMLSALKHLPETEFSKAHALAQKNAALPIEQGGLGLHPDNTAMERARALGFDTPAWRGSTADEVIAKEAPYGAMGSAHYAGDDPIVANTYASEDVGSNILPLLLQGKYLDNQQWTDKVVKHGWDLAKKEAIKSGYSGVHDNNIENAFATFDPKKVRSRFAAFDPLKKNSANILAGAALGSTLLEKDKKRKDK